MTGAERFHAAQMAKRAITPAVWSKPAPIVADPAALYHAEKERRKERDAARLEQVRAVIARIEALDEPDKQSSQRRRERGARAGVKSKQRSAQRKVENHSTILAAMRSGATTVNELVDATNRSKCQVQRLLIELEGARKVRRAGKTKWAYRYEIVASVDEMAPADARPAPQLKQPVGLRSDRNEYQREYYAKNRDRRLAQIKAAAEKRKSRAA